MAEPKTRPTDASVVDFLAAVPSPQRRQAAVAVAALLAEVTGELPVLWGTSIVGYGSTELSGSGGRTTQWPVVGFSPRKAELVLYLNQALAPDLFENIGPHRRGVGCLYLKKLADVDPAALRALVERSVELARGA